MTEKKSKANPLDAVVCHKCGGYFTSSGLRMHVGSAKCAINTRAKPMKEAVKSAYAEMQKRGKRPVLKNVALALQRKGLTDLSGLESAPTKLVHSDIDVVILDEYWINKWVYDLWAKHNRQGYTKTAYSTLAYLKSLSLEDRESRIGMMLLDMYG